MMNLNRWVSADFSQYTFIQGLERKWPLILSELQLLLLREVENRNNHFDFWHERGIYEGQWKVFGLYAFGEKLTHNCDLCPVTTEIVESIPGMTWGHPVNSRSPVLYFLLVFCFFRFSVFFETLRLRAKKSNTAKMVHRRWVVSVLWGWNLRQR